MKVPTLGSARCAGWHFHWDGEGSGDDDACRSSSPSWDCRLLRENKESSDSDSFARFGIAGNGRRFDHRIFEESIFASLLLAQFFGSTPRP